MTRPTGRPRGRPKTKEYVSVTTRMDIALAEQLKGYATRKRQSLSDVVRDGLQLLFSEQDPWHPTLSDSNGDEPRAFLSDRNESPLNTLAGEVGSAEREELLSDMKEEVVEALLSDTNRDKDIVSDIKEAERIMSDTKAVSSDIVSDTKTAVSLPTLPEGQVWGKPCDKNPAHVDPQTGRTVRRRGKDLSTPTGYFDRCRACEHDRKQARRQAKRQAAHA